MAIEGWKPKLLGAISTLAVLLVFEPVREILVQVTSETVLSRLRGPQDMTPELDRVLETRLHRDFLKLAPGDRQRGLAETAGGFARARNLSLERALERQRELLSQWEEAEQSLQRSVDLVRQRRYGEARTEIISATRQDPANPAAWSNLGAIDIRLGKIDEGRDAYDRALALDPHDPVTRYNFGLFYARTKNSAAAVEQLVRAFALPKIHQDATLRASLIADLRGNPLLAEVRQRPEIRRLLEG